MKKQFGRFGAVLSTAATLLFVSSHASGAPIQPGSNLSIVGTDSVAVNSQYIDWDFLGTASTGNPPVVTGGTVDGNGQGPFLILGGSTTGDFAGLAGSTAMVKDLCRTGPGACVNPVEVGVPTNFLFMTFTNGWTITLTNLLPGDFTAAGCAGLPGSGVAGQTCTPPVPGGSPFDLTNNGASPGGPVTGVGIQFTFLGVLHEGANGDANVRGTFSTSFAGTDLQNILAHINAGDTIVSGVQSTVTIQAVPTGVPEPSTFAFVVIGGLLVGATRLRRRSRA